MYIHAYTQDYNKPPSPPDTDHPLCLSVLYLLFYWWLVNFMFLLMILFYWVQIKNIQLSIINKENKEKYVFSKGKFKKYWDCWAYNVCLKKGSDQLVVNRTWIVYLVSQSADPNLLWGTTCIYINIYFWC